MIGKKILWAIAEIQKKALKGLTEDSSKVEDYLIFRYIECGSDNILETVNRLHNLYNQISLSRDPQYYISMLSEYQLGICIHILFRMEEQWIQQYSQSEINSAWQTLFRAQEKFHPEYKIHQV